MKLLVTSPARSNLTGNGISVNGYSLITETSVVVGAVPLLIASPPSGFYTMTITLVNRSTGGQNIRVGFNPSIAPGIGILLTPGDSVDLYNLTFGISAVASAAGAVLDVFATAQLIQ